MKKAFVFRHKLSTTLLIWFFSFLLLGLFVILFFFARANSFISYKIKDDSARFTDDIIAYYEEIATQTSVLGQIILRSRDTSDLNILYDPCNPFATLITEAKIKRTILSAQVLDDCYKGVYLYLPDIGRVLNSVDMYEADRLFGELARYEAYTLSYIEERVSPLRANFLLPPTYYINEPLEPLRVMPMVVTSFSSPKAILLVNIDEGAFIRSFFAKYGNWGDSAFIVMDKSGEIISASFENTGDASVAAIASATAAGKMSDRTRLARNEYILARGYSDALQWQFVSFLDAGAYSDLLSEFIVMSCLLLALFALIGITSALTMRRSIVQPILNLGAFDRKNGKDIQVRFQELGAIYANLTRIDKDNFTLQEQVDTFKEIELDMMFGKMLRSGAFDRRLIDDMRLDASRSSRKNFFVITLCVMAEKAQPFRRSAEIRRALQAEMKKLLSDDALIRFTEADYMMYSAIIGTEKTDAARKSDMERLLGDIAREFSVNVFLGIGGLVEDIEEIHLSYDDSLAAMGHCRINKQWDLRTIESTTTPEAPVFLAPSELMRIRNNLAEHNWDALLSALDETIRRYLDRPEATIKNMRGLVFCLCNIDQFVDVSSSLRESLRKSRARVDETLLSRGAFSQERVREMILSFYTNALVLDSADASRKADLSERLVRLIQERYGEELYIEAVADEMNMSAKYLARAFKLGRGVSFHDYLTSYRIGKASQLLISTDMLVEDIAASVGFNNRVTFARAFKSIEGMSPSAYREAHQVEASNSTYP